MFIYSFGHNLISTYYSSQTWVPALPRMAVPRFHFHRLPVPMRVRPTTHNPTSGLPSLSQLQLQWAHCLRHPWSMDRSPYTAAEHYLSSLSCPHRFCLCYLHYKIISADSNHSFFSFCGCGPRHSGDQKPCSTILTGVPKRKGFCPVRQDFSTVNSVMAK